MCYNNLYKKMLPSFLIIAVSVLIFTYQPSTAHADKPEIQISVKSSPDAQYSSSRKLSCVLLNGTKDYEKKYAFQATDVTLHASCHGGNMDFILDTSGNLHKSNGNMVELKPKARAELLNQARLLRSQHYGEPLRWSEVNELLPRLAKFTVIDLETGLRFQGQRRAGSSHADVQPLTKSDSETMKKIYGGKWSWSRRAILVQSNGRSFAASMNGMPHGGDGIPDNDFKGHFCIHFIGSTTHSKNNVDLGHQIMATKASGTLSALMMRLTPYQIIDAYFLAGHYRDQGLMSALMLVSSTNVTPIFSGDKIVKHRILEPAPDHVSELAIDIPVESCEEHSGTCINKSTKVFHLRRLTFVDAWQIENISQL
jgi:hypothetical protein